MSLISFISLLFLVLLAFVQSRGSHASRVPRLYPRVAQASACPVLLSPQPPVDTLSRITGGRKSGSDLASSMVLLQDIDNFFCTGVLVAPDIVMLNAACDLNNPSAYVGVQNLSSLYTIPPISIQTVVPHPSFNLSSAGFSLYNIAYAVLTSSAPSSASPMKVNNNFDYPSSFSVVRKAGYGYFSNNTDDEDSTNVQRQLHQVDLPLVDIDECAFYEGYDDVVIDDTFCSGYQLGGCDSW